MGNFLAIFTDVVLPVLLLVGLGSLLQKFKPLDIITLTKVTVWLLVPSFLFVKVYESDLTWEQIFGIAGALLLPMILVAGIMYLILRRLRVPGPEVSAIIMGAVVVNAGNFGIPVAQLLYGDGDAKDAVMMFPGMKPADGVAVQALCVLISNLVLWCFGYIVISLSKGRGWRGALGYFKLPMIYAIALAFILRDNHIALPKVAAFPLHMLTDATVPIMLLTLGAQLVKSARWPRWKVVLPVAAIQLIVMPLVTWPLVIAMGMWPWPGVQLVISAAGPAAVNVLLITLELEGDAELAADCVFWSTVFCAVTCTVCIALASLVAV
ncbi:MAG: AEC family transporter [Phycisphaeraceae bacterium]